MQTLANSKIRKICTSCILFAVFLHGLATAGQNLKGYSPRRELEENTCKLSGAVVKSTTGEPVSTASVSLRPTGWPGREYSAITDSTGHFTLNGVEPGLYFLDAQAIGFPSQRYREGSSIDRADVLSLKPGGAIEDIRFRLVPGGIISGLVRDEEGDPVVGAHVAALRRFRGRMFVNAEAETNDRGEYRLFWLAPGEYYVAASIPNELNTGFYPPTYYPDAPRLEQAMPAQSLPDREMSGINIRSGRTRKAKISGRVLLPIKEGSAQSVSLQLIPRDNVIPHYFYEGRATSSIDQNGRFEFHSVPSGFYILYAYLDQPNGGYSGLTEVNVDNTDEISGILVSLKPNVDLTAHLRADPGAKLDLSKLTVSLEPKQNLMSAPIRSESKLDGTFMLKNIRAVNYRVHVRGYPEGFYFKSARIGDVDVLLSGLSVDDARTGGVLELELSRKGGRIDGVVEHELRPAAGALVTLVPDLAHDGRDDLYMQKTADLLGRFSFFGVPPGDFRIFAWEDADDSRINAPEFLRAHDDLGKHIHTDEMESQTVQLELIAGVDLH